MAARTGLSLDSVDTLVINPHTPSTLYAGGLSFDPVSHEVDGGGVFKSINGGGSWVAIGLAEFEVNVLAIDPNMPNIVYAGTADQGVFMSINGGTIWRAVNTGLSNLRIFALAVDSQRMVYAGTRGDGLFKAQVPATP